MDSDAQFIRQSRLPDVFFSVSGFGWSGSSAVADWLQNNSHIHKPRGGEIKAVGIGAVRLLEIAGGRRLFGRRLAEMALLPDPSMRSSWFGGMDSFLYDRGKRWKGEVLDLLYTIYRLGRGDSYNKYAERLNNNIAGDFRSEGEYLELIGRFVKSLQYSERPKLGAKAKDDSLVLALSDIVSYFYRVNARESSFPVFDNMIPLSNPENMKLILSANFANVFAFVVRRDPRDQFADMCSRGVMKRSAIGRYIRNYRSSMEGLQREIDSKEVVGSPLLFGFEEFVLDENGCRARLQDMIDDVFCTYGIESTWGEGPFVQAESEKNIGLWRGVLNNKESKLIETELPQYIWP